MPTQKGTLTGSNTGGATGSAQGAPQLISVFSYHSEGGGDVYVYLAQSDVAKFAIATFDDTSSEVAYSIQTLTSSTPYEAQELIEKASREWGEDEENNNPFTELLRDKEAMERLHALLAQFFESDE